MSSLVKATHVLVYPDHTMFGIADAAAGDAKATPAAEELLAINPHHVLIGTAQDGFGVDLRIELWDDTAPSFPADHDMAQTIVLDFPAGTISINQIVSGWVKDVFHIPPGRYWLRLTSWDRARARRLFWEIGHRTHFDDENLEFAALRDGAYGRERYLAQLWPHHGEADASVSEDGQAP